MEDPIKNLDHLKILYIENSHFAPDWHSTMHSHPFSEIIYVLKGSGTFHFSDNTSFGIKQDDLVIINPNTPHTERSTSQEGLDYLVVAVDGLEFTNHEMHANISIHSFLDKQTSIHPFIHRILYEKRNPSDVSTVLIEHIFKVILISIFKETTTTTRAINEVSKVNKDIRFIQNYIEFHYRENLTLDDLANLVFLNKYYFSHIFKKECGISPIDYLIQVRMRRAKGLLENTDLNITQISNIVGFISPAYFSQYFKKQFNCSPTQYRKNQIESSVIHP